MLTTADIIKKVRAIEIKTKGLTNHIFGGEYHSAFKGRGMSFSEVREYSYGDDVRNIDWNVTARFKTPFVKVFEEERELTLMLMVDISASTLYGTHVKSKRELITEICAILAFSAITNNDKVGIIFFSDKIEKYIPPKKGKSHILYIIRTLITLEPHAKAQTNIEVAIQFLNNIAKKRAITFLISDFISPSIKQGIPIAARKHDLVGIHIYDQSDSQIPNVGLLQMQDWETGNMAWVDTASDSFRKKYKEEFEHRSKQNEKIFLQYGASFFSIHTQEDYIKKMQLFFKSRR